MASAAQRSVTLKDVARAAGVGKSTVSNVLNGSGRVGEAARARVLETVEQLGYRPHHGARSMRSRRTMQLAYLMPLIQLEPTNLIMMQFMQSLLTAGAQQHYRVLVIAQDADQGNDIRGLVAGRIVDGFVLSELQPDDQRTDLLAELGMPFACFGRTRAGLPQPWADIDTVAAEAEAVRHVVERGYTRPGYCGRSSTATTPSRERSSRPGCAKGKARWRASDARPTRFPSPRCSSVPVLSGKELQISAAPSLGRRRPAAAP
jgi:DNA-binding LacI/PurR family transcriptional regulator